MCRRRRRRRRRREDVATLRRGQWTRDGGGGWGKGERRGEGCLVFIFI